MSLSFTIKKTDPCKLDLLKDASTFNGRHFTFCIFDLLKSSEAEFEKADSD